MKLGHKLRHYWHEVYFSIFSESGVDFAVRCKDVTAHIDLRDRPKGVLGQFRFWLHLSLCQACDNYMKFSLVLGEKLREYSKLLNIKSDLDQLNKSLLEKYSKKKT